MSWAQGGVFWERIRNTMNPAVINSIGAVNGELQSYFQQASALGPFRLGYYLPGIAGERGKTIDDVSLVLVRR